MANRRLKCDDCDFEWSEDMSGGWTERFIRCPRCGEEYTEHK